MNDSIDCCCRGPFGFTGALIDFTSFFIFGGMTPQLKSIHCLTRKTNLVSQKPGSNQVLHVGESCSMPSSAVPHHLFIPTSVAWAAGLSRWGYPPLNPGRPPERAGESTRAPLISPEKLALPRPARGAPLASSLVRFFREVDGRQPALAEPREQARRLVRENSTS